MGNIRGGTLGFHGTIGQPTAQVIDGSLMFNGVNQHLTRTFGSGGNRRTFTLSYWIKEHGKGSSPYNNPHILWSGSAVETRGGMVHRGTGSGDANRIYMFNQVSNSTDSAVWTNSLHRDFSGWKHVVFKVDSTQGTGTNRVKIYINGVEQDDEYKTTPSQNLQFQINVAQEHRIGRGIPDDYGNFSLSQYYFIDGQALGPEYFAFTDPLTNTWRPIKYTGTYGTTGFWLPMDNQDNFEKDRSGNGNHWTKNNFSGTFNDPNVLKDSPSGAVFGGRAQTGITTTSSAPANYATLNPLNHVHGAFSEGNLEAQSDTSGQYSLIPSTLLINKTGKFYWEAKFNIGSSDAKYATIGICSETRRMTTNEGLTAVTDVGDYSIKGWDGGFYTMTNQNITYNNGSLNGTRLNDNDVLQLAFNADNGKLWFGINGTYLTNAAGVGNPSLDLNPDLTAPTNIGHYPAFGAYNSGGNSSQLHANFGQKPFKYAPPQGFLPLNSATARPNKVIPRPDQYVGIVTYKGTGTTSQSIRGLNFDAKPDVVWIKDITSSSNYSYRIADSVRGSTNVLFTNATNGTQTNEYGTIDQFAFNGFDLRQGSNNNGDGSNTNNSTLIAWCFKAGGKVGSNAYNIDDVGYATAAAAGLDGGSISPTGASIGTKQGFSIIQYTGTDASSNTFSHGLTQAPDFALFKNTSQSGDDWIIYHSALGATKRLKLNSANAADSQTSQFNDTEPTSSLFTIGTYDNINKLNNSYIAYLWHNVPGLQKFGEYKGATTNGGIGHFVETGFRPAFLIVKKHDGVDGGVIMDSEFMKFNPMRRQLRPNENGPYSAEYDDFSVDFYANGFRVVGNTGQMNEYNKKFVYMAWAEAPAYNLFGGQSNAR